MPYIEQYDRGRFDSLIRNLSAEICSKGELNYVITCLVHQYVREKGKKYDNLNDAVGVLECAKLELYRHIVGPYEDQKIEDNGDIQI